MLTNEWRATHTHRWGVRFFLISWAGFTFRVKVPRSWHRQAGPVRHAILKLVTLPDGIDSATSDPLSAVAEVAAAATLRYAL